MNFHDQFFFESWYCVRILAPVNVTTGGASTPHLAPQASQQQMLLVHRATKTAVHEVLHMYAIGHCVVAHCCMNGSGHVRTCVWMHVCVCMCLCTY